MGKVKASTEIIRWIEDYCRVPDGKDVGKPIRLRPWQKKEIKRIYDNPHGTRRAILSFGRKNGKTCLAALLLLVHLCGPRARQNSQLCSTGQSRDQASFLYNYAAAVVRMSPELRDYVDPRDTLKQLYCRELGTLYRALSADSSTAWGGSPVFVVHDELGQVKGPRFALYEAMETGMGAHENPLSIVISTQAPTDGDLLSILIDDALSDSTDSDSKKTVCSVYKAPDDLDPFDEATIKLANPAFGDFLNAKETRDTASAAKRMPAREGEYRNKILNQRVEAESPFVSRSVWEANGDDPEGWGTLYGGLDLSVANDLTALVLVSPFSGTYSVRCRFWLPHEGLAERSRQDRVEYDVWHKQGFLHTVPGNSIDYGYVAQYIAELFQKEDIRKIAFDRYNMRHFRPWLIKAGMSESLIDDRFVDFGQGTVSMHPALRTLESLLLDSRLRHSMHPVLRMCAENSVVTTDSAGWTKLDKKRSRGRIDGMVALAMACSVASENQARKHVFQGVRLEDITVSA